MVTIKFNVIEFNTDFLVLCSCESFGECLFFNGCIIIPSWGVYVYVMHIYNAYSVTYMIHIYRIYSYISLIGTKSKLASYLNLFQSLIVLSESRKLMKH